MTVASTAATTEEDRAFRADVASFFAEHVPERFRARIGEGVRLEPDDYRAWQKVLHRRGWGAPLWPAEHGGTGWSPARIMIFEEEAALARAPTQYHQGLNLIAPILMAYGSEDQRNRFLSRILSADHWWCQGYSEPGAGSDLASLKTAAILEGDAYVVTGQKVWTSYAHVASHIFCLVRTSVEARKQAGLSLLLFEMDSPGVSVRPIVTIDGRHHTNEVFLDRVRVPVANLVGEAGRGWGYGKALLERERALAMSSGLRLADHLRSVKLRLTASGGGDDLRALSRRIAELEIEVGGLSRLILKALAESSVSGAGGATSSMLKLLWSNLLQRVTECGLALPHDGEAVAAVRPDNLSTESYFYNRSTTIYGGTTEIQRDVIARTLLGRPG